MYHIRKIVCSTVSFICEFVRKCCFLIGSSPFYKKVQKYYRFLVGYATEATLKCLNNIPEHLEANIFNELENYLVHQITSTNSTVVFSFCLKVNKRHEGGTDVE